MLKFTFLSAGAFVIARHFGLFGEKEIVIPKSKRHGSNSYGENWFTVKRGLFYDEVVEYEEWAGGQDMKVASYGWSFGRLYIKYE